MGLIKHNLGDSNNNMTPSEVEAFKRGIMIAFVTTAVREAVHNVFRTFPDFQGMREINQNELAARIIYRTYLRLNIHPPTMEESIINVDTIKTVGKEIADLTRATAATDMIQSAQRKKEDITKQQIRNEWYDPEESKRSGMNRLSKKEREELR